MESVFCMLEGLTSSDSVFLSWHQNYSSYLNLMFYCQLPIMTLSGQNVVGCSYIFLFDWSVAFVFSIKLELVSNYVNCVFRIFVSKWGNVGVPVTCKSLIFSDMLISTHSIFFFYLPSLIIDINLEFCLHKASHSWCLQTWSWSHVKIISQQRDVSPFLPWLLTAFFPLFPWWFNCCFA